MDDVSVLRTIVSGLNSLMVPADVMVLVVVVDSEAACARRVAWVVNSKAPRKATPLIFWRDSFICFGCFNAHQTTPAARGR